MPLLSSHVKLHTFAYTFCLVKVFPRLTPKVKVRSTLLRSWFGIGRQSCRSAIWGAHYDHNDAFPDSISIPSKVIDENADDPNTWRQLWRHATSKVDEKTRNNDIAYENLILCFWGGLWAEADYITSCILMETSSFPCSFISLLFQNGQYQQFAIGF